MNYVYAAGHLIIHNPLRTLYFNGPTALGFWGGALPQDICFSLTGTPSVFWAQHVQECMRLCEHKFDAFAVIITFGVYVALVFRCVEAVAMHLCFTRPILCELRRRRKTRITQSVDKHA
jgi:hypothetical protein